LRSRIETFPRSQSPSVDCGLSQRQLDDHTSLIAVAGELDLSTAPRLKWMLIDSLETGLTGLIVDLTAATFMDSTALGVLVGVKRRLGVGEGLAIICPHPDVLKIFEVAGMDGIFAICSSLDEALANVRGHAAHSA
jgi:anti-sigma B factor antagonist